MKVYKEHPLEMNILERCVLKQVSLIEGSAATHYRYVHWYKQNVVTFEKSLDNLHWDVVKCVNYKEWRK